MQVGKSGKRIEGVLRDKEPIRLMRIVQTSYKVVSAIGTMKITVSRIVGLRLRRKVLVSAVKREAKK